jgi:hypothetical protein
VRIPQFELVLGVSCEAKIEVKYLGCETVVVCVSRSLAGKRIVETENPSACVTQLLINPITRTRTLLISGVYHILKHSWYHNTLLSFFSLSLSGFRLQTDNAVSVNL